MIAEKCRVGVLLYSILPIRAVEMSENPGEPVLFSGHNLPPLVEIGLTDLPKSVGAMALLAPPGTTGLTNVRRPGRGLPQ